jgi:hypothetical protein
MALMQFMRLRRGVSEVVHTVEFDGDASAVLAEGARLVRRGRWPGRADGLRAIDQCGRTLMRWGLAVDADQPSSPVLAAALKRGTAEKSMLPLPARDVLETGSQSNYDCRVIVRRGA